MHYKRYILTLMLTLLFAACNSADMEIVDKNESLIPVEANETSTPIDTNETSGSGSLKIIGKIEYERIHPLHDGGSSILDKSNVTTETAKQIIVEAIDRSDHVVARTSTDDNGTYTLLNLPKNTDLKIRAYAKMYKANKWDTKVIDNTNGNAQYIIEGSLVSTGTHSARRNLKALSSTKQSPPFSILDSIYLAMKKVLAADNSVEFPPLKMNWTINNIESGTYYDGKDNIMIQGDQLGDSDEYDDHIMIHEWGHYFEAQFSRADSIGGQHTAGDYLDIRLAFGEGWGNAWSAIATDDPIYFDTFNNSGWNMNIETAKHDTPGWFSEASIQRILYDLYDSHNDGADKLSLGFKPLYNVLVGKQKTTKAFTSLFSFITELKNANSSDSGKIDAIVASESIATIDDIYGGYRLNNLEALTYPIYNELTIGERFNNTCTSTTYGLGNKLNNHKFIRFTINSKKSYTIKVIQNNGRDADPDFSIYQTSPFKQIALSEGEPNRGREEATFTLKSGQYLLDFNDASNQSKACFDVIIN